MNFYQYIGCDKSEFELAYLESRLVNEQFHPTLPLAIYSYGRETVHGNKWDNVTTKCRGIVVNRETDEVVARPFEKFFNFGQQPIDDENYIWTPPGEPTVWEKVDGFMCTMYQYNGESYVASKGSFTSPHAKWATAWYRKNVGFAEGEAVWPEGYTPVFEGITPNLRIVVDYGRQEKLVLLALINIETGEELDATSLAVWAKKNGVETAKRFKISMQQAHAETLNQRPRANEEGDVLSWSRPGQPPFRLKLKFIEYLRLHRMVTGVSPKHILEVLQNGWTTEMDELLNQSTPWFNHFVAKWKTAFEAEYKRLDEAAEAAMGVYRGVLQTQYLSNGILPVRKDWAMLFTRPETKEVAAVLFAMMDGKDKSKVIWKMVSDKRASLTHGQGPMVDALHV